MSQHNTNDVARTNAQAYNRSYRAGIYANRYGEDTINFASETNILLTADRIKKDPLTILSFGAGFGREHYIYEKIAQEKSQAKSKNTEQGVHVVAFDVSAEALKLYEQKLINAGYAVVGGNKLHDDYDVEPASYIGPILQKDNIKVSLVFGNSLETSAVYTPLLQQASENHINLSLCEFGPLSHIQGRLNRQATLKRLGDLTSHQVLVSVPNDAVHVRSQYPITQAYETADDATRMQYGLEGLGDTRFRCTPVAGRPDAYLFYHFYTPQRFAEDCKAADLELQTISGLTLRPEKELAHLTEGKERIKDYQEITMLENAEALSKANFLMAQIKGKRRERKTAAIKDARNTSDTRAL